MRNRPDTTKNIQSTFTWETAAYGLLLALALLLRLVDLDSYPLNAAEAGRALNAWQLARGAAPDIVGSPLLLHGTALSFFLFSANDFTARLFPALFGAALVLVPALWRGYLGRMGALLAAGLLTFSPLAVYYSRYLGPQILVAGSTLLVLTAAAGFADSRDNRYLYLGAVGTALLLASGPSAYFTVLILVAAGVVAWTISPHLGGDLLDRLRKAGKGRVSERARTAGLLFLGTALAAGSLFLLHLTGLRGFADVLTEWWNGFSARGGLPWFGPLLWPVFYEPVVLVFGIVGGAVALRRRDAWGGLLLGFSLGAAAMLLAWPAHTSGDLLLVSVPLTLLAAKYLAGVIEDLRADFKPLQDGAFIAIFAILWVYVYLQVSGYVDAADAERAARAAGFSRLAWIGVGLMGVLVIGNALMHGVRSTLRSLSFVGMALGAVVVLSVTLQASYNASSKGAELLDPVPSSPVVRTLAADVQRLSLQRAGDERSMAVTVVSKAPDVVSWYLRDMSHLTVRDGAGNSLSDEAVIADEGMQPRFDGTYSGQAYEVQRDHHWRQLSARDFWRWVLYRNWPVDPAQRMILWVRLAVGEAS